MVPTCCDNNNVSGSQFEHLFKIQPFPQPCPQGRGMRVARKHIKNRSNEVNGCYSAKLMKETLLFSARPALVSLGTRGCDSPFPIA